MTLTQAESKKGSGESKKGSGRFMDTLAAKATGGNFSEARVAGE
jgi:hypothetical protein